MKVFIFAAGLGTRLKPITDSLPKALVPVASKPLLSHVIEHLYKQGCKDFVVNVHHFADKIKNYLIDNKNFGLNIDISDESDFLRDTGGAIDYARELLTDKSSQKNSFLVHNVDILSNFDLKNFVEQSDNMALANILVSDRKTTRYFLFDENNLLVGWTNIQTGQIKSPYKNLDISKCSKLAFSGIHLISNEIFSFIDDIRENPSNFPLYNEKNEELRLEKLEDKFSIVDLYLRSAAKAKIKGLIQENLKMLDVGKLNSLEEAENFVS